MTAIAPPRPDAIYTTARGTDECAAGPGHSIDTGGRKPASRWIRSLVLAISTTPEVSAEANAWIEQVLPVLYRIAQLPDDWDGEGSPSPDPAVLAAARGLLERLYGDSLGAIPVPFLCPVPGGGIQFEWSSSGKHLEIELLDARTIAFLKEEMSEQGETTESGVYPLADTESTRLLLDWLAAI